MKEFISSLAVYGIVVISICVLFFQPTKNKVQKFSGKLNEFFTSSFWEKLWCWLCSVFAVERSLRIGLGMTLIGVMQCLPSYVDAVLIMTGGVYLSFYLLYHCADTLICVFKHKQNGWNDVEDYYKSGFRTLYEFGVVCGLSVQHIPLWKTTNIPELAVAFVLLIFVLIKPKNPSWFELALDILASFLLIASFVIFIC